MNERIRRRTLRAAVRIVSFVVLALAGFAVQATRLIDPGETVRLKPDEGLLVVAVDSDSELTRIRFQRIGSSWSGATFRSIKTGRTTRLYAVPAGRYRWTKVTQFENVYYISAIDLTNDPEFEFEVKPGRINYAGDLVYRSTGFLSADMRLSNRALPVIDWLETQHAEVFAAWPFGYTGHYPDPFPEFYASLRTQYTQPATGLDAGRSAPKPSASLPLPPRELWRPARVVDIALSPDGKLIAQAIREETIAPATTKDDGKGRQRKVENAEAPERVVTWSLHMYDVESGASSRVVGSDLPFKEIRWESDRILLATTYTVMGPWLHILHVGDPVGGRRSTKRIGGPVGGGVVDLLPAEPGVVLYQRRNSKGELVVHRLRLDSEKAVKQFERARYGDRLNVGVSQDISWFADGKGQLRAAFARRGEDDVVLMHGGNGRFREVLQYDASSGFQPLVLSYDGERFFGFMESGRAQRDFVEFDPALGQVTRTVHSKPGVDLVSAVFDERRTPIGVRYYREGQLVTDYFDQSEQRLDQLLRQAFPGRSVAAIERSRDAGTMTLWVDGSDQPAQLYLLNVRARTAELFADLVPELAGHRFVPAQVLKVRGSDGLNVDAFLTLPPGTGRRPLVVMAHGGPIGVSDDLHFNRNVQFIASLGYAVLQVNFRGSDGYGTAFREAGYRNYGRMIEDDIDAAINAVLASFPVDESRMCAVGSSYGGYSALVSTIRWPARFKCAVAIAGVSDRALFFTASDSGRDASTRKEMEKIMGDPTVATDLENMRATSPLYRYEELQVPVMLVHGYDDARVDYEHTRRLVRMLNLAGRTPVLMSFENEGHRLEDIENVEAAWTGIAGFLQQHLGSPPLVAAPAASSGDGASEAR